MNQRPPSLHQLIRSSYVCSQVSTKRSLQQIQDSQRDAQQKSTPYLGKNTYQSQNSKSSCSNKQSHQQIQQFQQSQPLLNENSKNSQEFQNYCKMNQLNQQSDSLEENKNSKDFENTFNEQHSELLSSGAKDFYNQIQNYETVIPFSNSNLDSEIQNKQTIKKAKFEQNDEREDLQDFKKIQEFQQKETNIQMKLISTQDTCNIELEHTNTVNINDIKDKTIQRSEQVEKQSSGLFQTFPAQNTLNKFDDLNNQIQQNGSGLTFREDKRNISVNEFLNCDSNNNYHKQELQYQSQALSNKLKSNSLKQEMVYVIDSCSQTDNNYLQQKALQSSHEIQDQQIRLDQLLELNSNLNAQIKQNNFVIGQLREDNQLFKYQLQKQDEQFKKKEIENRKLKEFYDEHVNELNFKVQTYRDKCNQVEIKYFEEAKKIRRQNDEKIESIKGDFEILIEKEERRFKNKVEDLQKCIQQMQNDLDLKDKHIKDSEKEIQKLTEHCALLELRLERMQIVSLNVEEELNQQILKLQEQFKESIAECQYLRRDNEDLEKEIQVIGQEMFKLNEQSKRQQRLVYGKGSKIKKII